MDGELNDRERDKPLNSGTGDAISILFRYLNNKLDARTTSLLHLALFSCILNMNDAANFLRFMY